MWNETESELPKRLLCLDAFVINQAAQNKIYGDALVDWLRSQDVSVLIHRLALCEILNTTCVADLEDREGFIMRIPSLIFGDGKGTDVIDIEVAIRGYSGEAPTSVDVLRPFCAPVADGAKRTQLLGQLKAAAADELAVDREWNHAKVFHRALQLAEGPKIPRRIGEILEARGANTTPEAIVARVACVQTPLGKGLTASDRLSGLEAFQEFAEKTSFEDVQHWLRACAEDIYAPMEWFYGLLWTEFERLHKIWIRIPHAFNSLRRCEEMDYRIFCMRLNTLDPTIFRSLDVFWSVSNRYHKDPRRKQDASSTRDFWHLAFSPHVPVLVADREMAEIFRQCRRKLLTPGVVLSGGDFRNAVHRATSWERLVSGIDRARGTK